MAKRAKRVRLVIDASILRAAGDRSVPARSCRDFLEAVLEICHQVVACGELSGEWRRHRSRYSAVWQRRMISRKKFKVDSVRAPLKEAVEDLDLPDGQRLDLLKDLHLVEMALQTDGRVASLDESARGLFARASTSLRDLRSLTWVNPMRSEDGAIEWLEKMCPREPERSLGRHAGGSER
jgi:hypothetical protein